MRLSLFAPIFTAWVHVCVCPQLPTNFTLVVRPILWLLFTVLIDPTRRRSFTHHQLFFTADLRLSLPEFRTIAANGLQLIGKTDRPNKLLKVVPKL